MGWGANNIQTSYLILLRLRKTRAAQASKGHVLQVCRESVLLVELPFQERQHFLAGVDNLTASAANQVQVRAVIRSRINHAPVLQTGAAC